MLPIKTILVPIDRSESSQHTFKFAASLAQEHDAQLVVLYVVPLAAVMYGPPPNNYLDHLLQELCLMKPSDPHARVQYQVAEGDPAAAIVRAAKETNCDLIVMGTHGRTGLSRFLMGSVAEQVVRLAPCLVMTVRNQVPTETSAVAASSC